MTLPKNRKPVLPADPGLIGAMGHVIKAGRVQTTFVVERKLVYGRWYLARVYTGAGLSTDHLLVLDIAELGNRNVYRLYENTELWLHEFHRMNKKPPRKHK